MEWTFQQCFSIPRDVSPSVFDPVFAEYVDSGRDSQAVIRDVRVVPRDPTEEGWTDWCAEGRLEAEEMSDEVADELAWEVFSRAAYDRVRQVFEENEWTSGTTRRVEAAAPRHPWGIPLKRQRNTVRESGDVAQLKARLLNPWAYERQVHRLEGLPVEDQAQIYAVMQAVQQARREVRDAEDRGDAPSAETWTAQAAAAEAELERLERALGLDVGAAGWDTSRANPSRVDAGDGHHWDEAWSDEDLRSLEVTPASAHGDLWVLRGETGRPHLVAEVRAGRIVDVRQRGNRPPTKHAGYIPALERHLESRRP